MDGPRGGHLRATDGSETHETRAHTSFSHLLAHQYHHQTQGLAPSSHLPPQYHAAPASLDLQQQAFADHSLYGGSRQDAHTEPIQRILTWQNGMYDAPQQPAGSLDCPRAAPYHADMPPPPPTSAGPGEGATVFPRSSGNRARASTALRTITNLPSDSANAAPPSLPPASAASGNLHFQDPLSPPPNDIAVMPQTFHFHPLPPATVSMSLSQPVLDSQYGPLPPAVAPKTIDCNPARQTNLHFGSAPRRTESSSSLSMPSMPQHQHIPASQPHFAPATASSGASHTNPSLRAADWDQTGTPLRHTHARFQSASNVRGAPTEAFDGTPGPKFVWDAHGRLATMESIASSQWSPVVNDMYRLVDPLRPNFDFSAMLDEPPASPTKAHPDVSQPSHPGQFSRRVSSFSSIASGPVQSPPPTSFMHGPAASAQSMQQRQYFRPSSGFQPAVVSSETVHSQYGQTYMQAPHEQMLTHNQQSGFGPQPVPTPQEDDPEDRRASSSTSISSAPLISPQDLHSDLRPSVQSHLAGSLNAFRMDEPVSQYLKEIPQNPCAYGEYFQDPYNPLSPTKTQNLPYVSQEGLKPASSWPAGLHPTTSGHNAYHQPHLQDSTYQPAPVVVIPVAELERHTLHDVISHTATHAEKVEIKRKRTPTRQETGMPGPASVTVKQSNQDVNETLRPAQDRAHRRLSSPVLSMRPNDSGEGDTLSDDDDEEDDSAENTSTDRSQPGGIETRYGSYASSSGGVLSSLAAASVSASLPVYPAIPTLPVPLPSASTSGNVEVASARDNQPAHSVPPPPDTSHLVRVVPYDEDDPELGRPRRQKLRFANDWYTPEWVRGDAAKKEGFCDLCTPGKWLQLKNSAFWYHRQYTHGISSVSGQPFSNPVKFRHAETDGSTEALCHQCDEWVMYTSKKQNSADDVSNRIPTNWFKHAHKCHFYVANRSKNDKPRGKRRKVSSSPDD